MTKGAPVWHGDQAEQAVREEVMSLRTVVSIAALVIGIACIAIISTDAFARPAGMTRLHHHHHHHHTVHHSGMVRH
jgi:hypothetical protein